MYINLVEALEYINVGQSQKSNAWNRLNDDENKYGNISHPTACLGSKEIVLFLHKVQISQVNYTVNNNCFQTQSSV